MKSKGTDRWRGVQSSKRLDFVGGRQFVLFFSAISGLKLNKKKTKAMWISSAKNNETKPKRNDNLNLFKLRTIT